MLVAVLASPTVDAQTAGNVKLTATINDLTVKSGTAHMVAVWVTKTNGTTNQFIKILWKQGADLATDPDGDWANHFKTFQTARAGSTAFDGYTSATAANYTAVTPPTLGNNPITVTWNCKDASNTLVTDGEYKFWIEYAEATGTHGTDTGGLTTSGLVWTKGSNSFTSNPVNFGAVGSPAGGFNFTNMSIVWTPTVVPAPEIAVEQNAANIADGGSKDFGSVVLGSSAPLTFTIYNTGNANLTGLTITKDGANSGDFTVTSSPVAPVAGPSGTATFIVSFAPTATGARAAAIHIASNDADENPFDINLTGTGVAPYDNWASGLSVAQNGPTQMPQGDGVTNLEKFAFNLNPAAPDVCHLTMGAGPLTESAGLPAGAKVGNALRIEFLRRKFVSAANPGITYKPQFSSSLGAWVDFTGTESVSPAADPAWERVTVDDTIGGTARFGRVKVEQNP